MITLFQEKAKAPKNLGARPSTKIRSFSALVYKVVKKIPKGKALTYKDVAKLAGNSKAYRAVGNILNKNRSKEIPCHRVIRSDGDIGGFFSGSAKKRRLLKREGFLK